MNMWTRSELKERGKAALHRNYWIVVLATLVVTALTGGTGNAAGNGSLQEGSNIAAGNGDAASNLIQTLFSFFGVAGDMIYKNLIGPMYNGMYVSFILILIITAFSVGLLFKIFQWCILKKCCYDLLQGSLYSAVDVVFNYTRNREKL